MRRRTRIPDNTFDWSVSVLLQILRLSDAATDANNGVLPLDPMRVWTMCNEILSSAPTDVLVAARTAWRTEIEEGNRDYP